MRFNGVDGFYSRVCAVIVRRGELMVDFVELEESLETCWAFVVGDLKKGFESAI